MPGILWGNSMGRSGWVRVAVTALLWAALVVAPTSPSQAAPGDITLTGTISSISGASDRSVSVYGPNGWHLLNGDGPGFSVTGPPGEYTVFVSEYAGPPGYWSFDGFTEPTLYDQDTAIAITLPLHTLALDVEYPGGAPAPAHVELTCYDASPPGWQQAETYAERDVNGQSSFVVADRGAGDDDCALTVRPEAGPIRYDLVPGNAAAFTHVVAPGSHIAGTRSDGLGNAAPAEEVVTSYDDQGRLTGKAETDATGDYDLEVDPGTHTVKVPWSEGSELYSYSFETVPLDVSADLALDLEPAVDTLTVRARTSGGAPAPSSANLSCSGTPEGQSLIEDQNTYSEATTGSDLTLPGTSTTDGQCWLDLDPQVGVRTYEAVSVPDGGGEITVVIDSGITITGQVTVPGITTFTDATVTVSPSTHDSETVDVAPDGSFTLTGFAAGDATLRVDVFDATVGSFVFERDMTLNGGENVALAPDLDYLDLYLLGPTGDPGTGDATLICSGDNSDTNSYTSVITTRSGTGLLRLPGYADDVNDCTLDVTWSDSSVVTRQVTLDPDVDTAVTLLKNGVTFQSDPFTSNDDDGVADALEAYAPNVGDGDDDGTPDYEQADVASLPEDGGGLGSDEEYVTVAGPDDSELATVATDSVSGARVAWRGGSDVVAGPPDGTLLLRGFLDFEVRNVTPGSTKTVVVHYSSTNGMNSYSTYDPGTGGWSQLPANRVKINPKSIELTLTDGGIGDIDGEVNGRVRHPGGGTKVDIEVPVVTGTAVTQPNEKGWYGGNVTVRWTVTDDRDTITPPANTVVATEGDDVTATSGQVCDKRGNCSVGQLKHLKIDKTGPEVTLSGPADGGTYTLGAVPKVGCVGSDPGGSGVPQQDCTVSLTGGSRGQGTGVGRVTVTGTATDRAGNIKRKTMSYEVEYAPGGLVAPKAGGKPKVFAKGSTVVVRLKVVDAAGAAVTPASAPAWVKPKVTGSSKAAPNQPVSNAKPDKGSVLVKRGKYWEYRWDTDKAKRKKTYLLTVKLDDGTTRTVEIAIG